MNMPCIVEWDLHHFRSMDLQDAQDERAQEFQEERRRYLLEDRPGLSLVTEALYIDEIGYPLDEALFALCEAWRRNVGVMGAAGNLVVLIREKAERMARDWAGQQQQWEKSIPDYDEDVPF